MNRVKTVTTPNKYLTKKIRGSNDDKKYSIPFLENKNKKIILVLFIRIRI